MPKSTMKDGVELRPKSIRIHFRWQGKTRRETLRIPPTKKNERFAHQKRAAILYEIERGSFDYAEHFPNSPHVAPTVDDDKPADTSIDHFITVWLDSRVAKKSTMKGYENSISRYLKPEFGGRNIATILKSELDLWRARMAKEYRPKTVNNALIPLRGAFAVAHGDSVIDTDPAAKLSNVRNTKRDDDIDPFELDEIAALMEAAPDESANMIEFWFASGLRTGELIALQWEDIDFAKNQIWIRRNNVLDEITTPKTSDSRIIDMHKRTRTALLRQKAKTGNSAGIIFRNPNTLRPWKWSENVRANFVRYCEKAGVRYRYPYQLRHTYASTMLSLGEPAIYVMHQMGHKSLIMMERWYGRWMEKANAQAGSAFDKYTTATG